MKNIWMVRAGRKAVWIDEFIEGGFIAIGWTDIGALDHIASIDELRAQLKKAYPNDSEGSIIMASSQVWRFKSEIREGELVLTYNPGERIYHLGRVTSRYMYRPNGEVPYHHVRMVSWERKINRDDLSTSTKNSLGAISTIFKLPDDAVRELLTGSRSTEETVAVKDELEAIKEDIEERSLEFIKDRIAALNWEEMQELVAGILRGMGYKTNISAKGADRGKDIVASPDGLGLEDPRIIVEVKHRSNSSMGAPEVRTFLGGLRQGEKALYVSTGGFSREARYEAERANNPITLVDLDFLVDLVVQYYDDFDTETKTLLPLKKLFWPI